MFRPATDSLGVGAADRRRAVIHLTSPWLRRGMMIPVKALKSACGSTGTETDHLRLCVVARLCQGCVGTCSSRVLTLSPAAPEGPLTCNGGLVKAQRDDGTIRPVCWGRDRDGYGRRSEMVAYARFIIKTVNTMSNKSISEPLEFSFIMVRISHIY